jgi:hypothetical protein
MAISGLAASRAGSLQPSFTRLESKLDTRRRTPLEKDTVSRNVSEMGQNLDFVSGSRQPRLYSTPCKRPSHAQLVYQAWDSPQIVMSDSKVTIKCVLLVDSIPKLSNSDPQANVLKYSLHLQVFIFEEVAIRAQNNQVPYFSSMLPSKRSDPRITMPSTAFLLHAAICTVRPQNSEPDYQLG